jgi:predicted house-cleaning noncanonical NTP pyrophosphatase (MazG superfamily)
MVFRWKEGSRIKISAQAAGERIETIREHTGHGVTAADVLADARSEKSPLHAAFEWNDNRAAEIHRLAQAGHLLRCLVYVRVRVQHPDEAEPRVVRNVRAMYPVVEDGEEGKAYQSTVRILGKAELREQLLATALEDLERFRAKYKQLRELAVVFQAVEDFRKALRAAKKRPASVRLKAKAATA